ncbi:PDK, partial [Symbiodinium natans]
MQKLPTHLRRVTITLQQACEEKEEKRAEAERLAQVQLSPMGSPISSPKGDKTPPTPSVDSIGPELWPEEDFIVTRSKLHAERESALRQSAEAPPPASEQALSRSGSKLSKHSQKTAPMSVASNNSDFAFGDWDVDEL